VRRLAVLWEAYLNSGSHHFKTATGLKLNRVLNLIFSLHFSANAYLIIAELGVLVVLLQRDSAKYISYILPFVALNTSYLLLAAIIVTVKNRTGSYKFTYLSTGIFSLYMFTLCLFLGPRLNLHIILLAIMPVCYIMYDYGRWKETLAHVSLMSMGLTASLAAYKLSEPIYPLPDDIADFCGYLAWFAAVLIIGLYSLFNWKQVYLTERQLADEKAHTEALLKETIPKLEIAEAKYRHLIDDSSDIIFQMDEEGKILSMNLTSRKLLGFNPEEMVGKTLYEHVPDGLEGDPELNRNIVKTHVRSFLDEQTLSSFRTTLRKKHMYEPIDVQITLQKNIIHWKLEIIGRISRIEEDVAQKFLEKEKGRYAITNNVTHAEILSQRLGERLARYFSPSELATIRICFREILINAIEHGNLGISFDEKTQEIEAGDYMEFLIKRQREERFQSRRVYVDYLINERSLMFRITDEGDGFDHKKFIARADEDPYIAMLEHGRGIIMTRNVFDSVVYNEKGNQVILTKRIRK